MANYLGLGAFVAGIMLLIVALDAFGYSGSIAYNIAHITDGESIWLLAGGAVAICVGLLLVFSRRPKG